MNWFQIMFLFLVRQLLRVFSCCWSSCELISNYVLIFGSTTSWRYYSMENCCELISNYVLIFGSTTDRKVKAAANVLWIDFKLCSYFWFDNNPFLIHRLVIVVNWFQIMFLFLVRQLLGFYKQVIDSCELISNYVLIFGSTTGVASRYPE